MWALWVVASAFGQEPPPVTFSFDSLLVATVQAEDRAYQARADELHGLLTGRISETVVIMNMGEVPMFEEQGYDGRTYMLTCPPDQYTGCALVVGQRAKSEYAVGGTLRVDGEGVQHFNVHFVDVEESREILNFGVIVGTDRDTAVITGVAALFDKIVQGAFDQTDVRGDIEDPKVQAEIQAARAKLLAASLDELEESLGELERGDPIEIIPPPKLTREELATYKERDDVPPWVLVDMSEREFLRFSNSGMTLTEWRRRSRGRFGQILLAVDGGGGGGPYAVHSEGRYLVGFDDVTNTFQDMQVDQFQEIRSGPQAFIEAAMLVGITSFAEVGAFVGGRNSQATALSDQDEVDKPSIVGEPDRAPISTSYYGVRGGLIPFPILPVRPSAHLSVAFWRGVSIQPEPGTPLRQLTVPNEVIAQVAPGVEIDTGQFLDLYIRGYADIPVGGNFQDSYSDPPPADIEGLQDLTEPSGRPGLGVGAMVGMHLRFTLLKDGRNSEGPSDYDDEEEEL